MLLKKTKLLFLSAFLIFPFLGINSLKLASLSIRKIFDTIPPSAPHGFHGEGGSTIYSIDLYWTNSSDSDLDHVNVYFSNAPLTNYGLYSQIPATPNTKGQATIGSLSLDTDYYFKLSSVDTADNEGEFTDYIKTRTSYAKDVSSPAEVTNFQVADPETGDSLDLSWTDPSDSDFFQVRIYRSTDSWFTPSEDYKITEVFGLPASSESYRDSGLTEGTTYYYRIKTEDNKGNISTGYPSAFGTPTKALDTTPPAPPSNIEVTDLKTGTSLLITWQNPTDSDFSHINIYCSEISESLGNLVFTNLAGTSQEDSSLTEGETYYYTLRSVDETGNESENIDQHSGVPTKEKIERIYGNDRFGTSVKVSQELFTSSNHVVLAHGTSFADALSGTTLANYLNAPLLLTQKEVVPSCVLQEIERLSPFKVYLLGGEGIISDQVKEVLERDYQVERLSGANRYETSIAVADEIYNRGSISQILIASGEDFPDALVSGNAASYINAPLLFTQKDSLPTSVKNFLTETSNPTLYLVGGEGVISKEVFTSLGEYGSVIRIAGSDRFDTCLMVNNYFFDNQSVLSLVVATGLDFPDALVASVLSGQNSSSLLITGKNLSQSMENYLNSCSSVDKIYLLGGESVISKEVENRIREIFE